MADMTNDRSFKNEKKKRGSGERRKRGSGERKKR